MSVWTHFIPPKPNPCVWRRITRVSEYECLNAGLSAVTDTHPLNIIWHNDPYSSGFRYMQNGRYTDTTGRMWIIGINWSLFSQKRTAYWNFGGSYLADGWGIPWSGMDSAHQIYDAGTGVLYAVHNLAGSFDYGFVVSWDGSSSTSTAFYDLSVSSNRDYYFRRTAIPYTGDAYLPQLLVTDNPEPSFPGRFWRGGLSVLFVHGGDWWALARGFWRYATFLLFDKNNVSPTLTLWKGPAVSGGDPTNPTLWTCEQKFSYDDLNASLGTGFWRGTMGAGLPTGWVDNGNSTPTFAVYGGSVYFPTGFWPDGFDNTAIYVLASGSSTATVSRIMPLDETGNGGFIEFDGDLYTVALHAAMPGDGTLPPTTGDSIRLYKLVIGGGGESWQVVSTTTFTGHVVDISTTQFLAIAGGFALYTQAELYTRFVWTRDSNTWDVYSDHQGTTGVQTLARMF